MRSDPAGERQSLTARFEEHKPHLRAVAHQVLGSEAETDDALQEAWLRIRDQDPMAIHNMRAWLTTVVARVCLNLLRSRRARHEAYPAVVIHDEVVAPSGSADPDDEAMVADAVGTAMLVVLETLGPAERLAFVLHDVFGVPFAEIASALDRSEAATQQLASRARRRVRSAPEPDCDLATQRRIVDAFFAASRDGDFRALLEVLDPEVDLVVEGGVLRADASLALRGAADVAAHTATYAPLHPFVRPALVNGAAGALVAPHGRLYCVMAFAIARGRIIKINALMDPERLAGVELEPES